MDPAPSGLLAVDASSQWQETGFELKNLEDTFETLSEERCRDLLASRQLGRVAFAIGGQPEIMPVNYAVDGAVIVFRTAPETKLAQSPLSRVAFEVDHWDPVLQSGWSVVVKGVAQDVTKAIDPFASALRSRKVVPAAPGERENWIAIYPSEITGRSFRRWVGDTKT
jgi:hypothetical protein